MSELLLIDYFVILALTMSCSTHAGDSGRLRVDVLMLLLVRVTIDTAATGDLE
ncbi:MULTISPECIES: hypothetical protein [Paenibacillus]|uniref:hypothetical protein n=1 Tax=Paenibacillus TaxID=44249 RepID=UPI0015C2FB8C|nr:hypothetical protein [Paenibacillus odorifer]